MSDQNINPALVDYDGPRDDNGTPVVSVDDATVVAPDAPAESETN